MPASRPSRLGEGEVYISNDRRKSTYHTQECFVVDEMVSPLIRGIDEITSDYEECDHCINHKSNPLPEIPETVQCPCGTGYAERKDEPIVEKTNGSWNQRRITHLYRHEGCPVGGHLVEEAGMVTVKAGPLFHPDAFSRRALGEGGEAVLADGGGQG